MCQAGSAIVVQIRTALGQDVEGKPGAARNAIERDELEGAGLLLPRTLRAIVLADAIEDDQPPSHFLRLSLVGRHELGGLLAIVFTDLFCLLDQLLEFSATAQLVR